MKPQIELYVAVRRQRARDGRARGLVLQRSAEAEQPLAAEDRDPVQHDRGDDLVRTAVRLQEPRDGRPYRAHQRRRDGREEHRLAAVAGPVIGDVQADQHCEVGADPVLALTADVEEAAAEGEADGEPGQDERRRVGERVRQVDLGDDRVDVHRVAGQVLERPVEPCADRELLVDRERVRADQDHDEPAEHERDQDGCEREQEPAQSLPQPHDAASSFDVPPPVIARPSSLSLV